MVSALVGIINTTRNQFAFEQGCDLFEFSFSILLPGRYNARFRINGKHTIFIAFNDVIPNGTIFGTVLIGCIDLNNCHILIGRQ